MSTPHSTMGKQHGFDDDQGQGTFFLQILDYIRSKLPKVFSPENVKGFVTTNRGKDLKTELESSGDK